MESLGIETIARSRFKCGLARILQGRLDRFGFSLWDWKHAEHDSDPVRLQFNFLFAGFAVKVIERQVRRSMALAVLYPRHVFHELGGSHASEAHPQPAFVEGENAAAPAESLSGLSAHLVQIDGLFNLQSLPAGDDDVPIDRREINAIAEDVAVMGLLHRNVDARTGGSQADGIPLL